MSTWSTLGSVGLWPEPLSDGMPANDAEGLRSELPGLGRSHLRSVRPLAAGTAFEASSQDQAAGDVPRGRRSPSWTRGSDGGLEWQVGSGGSLERPRFDTQLSPHGYAWFYLDVVSDDGQTALVVIAMLGNVFSPYYAAARRKNLSADPLGHSTMNVALYSRRGNAWALTERKQNAVRRTRHELLIGNSVMRWERGELLVDLDERRAPFGGSLRGKVRLTPSSTLSHHVVLDDKARHHWWPTALGARAEVQLSQPNLSFSGEAYHDVNAGDEGLEDGFRDWTWSRGCSKRGVVVSYDVTRKSGRQGSTRFVVDARGRLEELPTLPSSPLPRSKWRLNRSIHGDHQGVGKLVKSLEDTPFYARSLVASRVLGEDVRAVHETVSLDRFSSPWVQFLLPFRMGRQSQ